MKRCGTKQIRLIASTIVTVAMLLASHASVAAGPSNFSLVPVSEFTTPSLSSKKGIMLIYLEVDGISTTLEITRIGAKKKSARELPSAPIILKMDSLKKGLYATPFPKGEYQITTVKAPYYNLPYIFTTSGSKRWRFRIEPKSTNYVGHLLLEKERTSRNIFVKLLNRIESDRKSITKHASHLTSAAPLRSGTWLRDEYLELITYE